MKITQIKIHKIKQNFETYVKLTNMKINISLPSFLNIKMRVSLCKSNFQENDYIPEL